MAVKIFLILALNSFILETTYAYVYNPTTDLYILYNEQYTKFFQCQINATILRAALKAKIPVENVPARPILDKDVPFLLFTQKNIKNPQILFSTDPVKKIRSSNLNFNKDIIVYVHGYNQTIQDGVSNFTTYLLPEKDVNVIIVNWDSYATVNLIYARTNTVPRLGTIVRNFVQKLIDAGANPKRINLVGFSAGGEAIGLAGKTIKPRVGRITAFDPEGSCFNLLPPTKRISKTDADYVVIVHCSISDRALPPTVLGDATFYFNGGLLQPACVDQTTILGEGRCSHEQCGIYLFESLKKNTSYVGVKCSSSFSYKGPRNCDHNDRVRLSIDVPTSVRGSYYIETAPTVYFNY